MKKQRPPTPENCPVCGEDVPARARACPECGADDRSGWREDAESRDAVGADAGDFDYDEFVREEFESSKKPPGIQTMWWVTAIIVLGALIALYFLGLF